MFYGTGAEDPGLPVKKPFGDDRIGRP